MPEQHPYCGAPPLPGELLGRFNLDAVLVLALTAALLLHVGSARRDGRPATSVAAGWGLAAVAFASPLCALSVALFAARVGQHMLLILLAAPLIASGLPGRRIPLWPAAAAFFVCLWFWHMPLPYAATFRSTAVYWAMHGTLFGSAIALWAALIHAPADRAAAALAVGTASSMQMGLLGAWLALAGRPLFAPHYLTTAAWGLTPLQDQQLGGVLMWVPGIFLFLWVALRSAKIGWASLEGTAG